MALKKCETADSLYKKLAFFCTIMVLTLAMLNGGMASSYFNAIPTTPDDLRIDISSPSDNSYISSTSVEVKGTIKGNMPEGKYLWLLLNPHSAGNLWWPSGSNGGQIDPWNESWNVTNVDLGNIRNHNKKCDIAVFLVDENTKSRLKNWSKSDQMNGTTLSGLSSSTKDSRARITINL